MGYTGKWDTPLFYSPRVSELGVCHLLIDVREMSLLRGEVSLNAVECVAFGAGENVSGRDGRTLVSELVRNICVLRPQGRTPGVTRVPAYGRVRDSARSFPIPSVSRGLEWGRLRTHFAVSHGRNALCRSFVSAS